VILKFYVILADFGKKCQKNVIELFYESIAIGHDRYFARHPLFVDYFRPVQDGFKHEDQGKERRG
jgi:hypothetical protein